MTAANYGILYHSPSASDSRIVDILEEWLDRFLNFSKLNIIVDDFNIDWTNIEKSAKLKSLMDSVKDNEQNKKIMNSHELLGRAEH